jgi:hypothetical protein
LPKGVWIPAFAGMTASTQMPEEPFVYYIEIFHEPSV